MKKRTKSTKQIEKYYEQTFIKYKSNTKIMWKTLNELLCKKRKNGDFPSEFLESNTSNTIRDPLQIGNKFNEYFVKVEPKLAEMFNNNTNSTFQQFLTNNIPNSMFLETNSEIEIEKTFKSMNMDKSPRYDGINIKTI